MSSRSLRGEPRVGWVFLAALLSLLACRKTEVAPCQCTPPTAVADAKPLAPAPTPPTQEPTSKSPRVQPLATCDAQGQLPIEAARKYLDADDFVKGLACAAQASALAPNDVLAHAERGNALASLERFEEAKLAFARALAIDPDSLDALLGAAHLYVLKLPSSREHDELGSLYAERGLELAREQHDTDTAISFARLSAMAFNDIGLSKEAIERADYVLAEKKGDLDAAFERAVALFELCRFADAKVQFLRLAGTKEQGASAHYHLGLLLEREGKLKEAQAHFDQAHEARPNDFPPPVLVSSDEFRAEMNKVLASLPADMRRDTVGVPIDLEDLPQESDLTMNDPPLSPTILGLFRGPSLGETCEADPAAKPGEPCRSVVLYRKNLARAVSTRDELNEQIRVTLLHEIGHLRGEDDEELAARGLE